MKVIWGTNQVYEGIDATASLFVNANGTSAATSNAIAQPSTRITILFVHYVDASNYVALINGGGNLGDELEIYTDAPSGSSVSVYNNSTGALMATVTSANGIRLRAVPGQGWLQCGS